MALSNTNYEAHAKSGNISENWLFQLFNQDSYLSFDGTDDYVDLGTTTASTSLSLTSSTGVSIAMWVNFPTVGSSEYIFDNNLPGDDDYAGFSILKGGSNYMGILWGDTSGESSSDYEVMVGDTAVTADTWYFVAITSNFSLTTTNTKVYTATAAAGSVTANTVSNQGTAGITTPTYDTGTAYFGRGGTDIYGEVKIKNFGIWNEQITSAEVTALYNSGSYLNFMEDSGNYASSDNLISYWEFNNGDANVRDLKGTVSGTVNGAKYSEFLPIALNNTTVDDIFYHGVITSENIGIREKIDLVKSTASSNNISLDIANFQYQGDDFSAELLLGSNTYLNKGVRVFSQLNGDPDIADCEQIFHGRLTDISHSIDNIKLTVSSQRPWDKIEFPQTKHSKYNVYEPVVYGDFTPQTATDGNAVHDSVFPVPKIFTGEHEFSVIMPKSYGGSDNAHLHHYAGLDNFLCLFAISDSSKTSATTTSGGVNILNTVRKCYAAGWTLTDHAKYDGGQSLTWVTDPENAFLLTNDASTQNMTIDTDTYASATYSDAGVSIYTVVHTIPRTFRKTYNRSMRVFCQQFSSETLQYFDFTIFAHEWGGTPDDCLAEVQAYIAATGTKRFLTMSTGALEHFNFDQTPNYDVYEDIDGMTLYAQSPDELLFKLASKDVVGGGGYTFEHDQTIRIYYIQILAYIYFFYDTAAGDDKGAQQEADNKILNDIKYFYSGADGLTASWDSGAIAHGHDAHRDLLVRFSGQDSADPENWSALNTDRTRNTANDADINNWKIRYWQLEPTSLKEALEKLQYEFGFIAKYAPDGKLKYIYIKQSSELSADHTLTKSDVSNLQISNSSLSDVVTQIEVSNKRHPAESGRYFQVITGKNVTARTKYNFSSKENIMSVKFDRNIGTINTTPQTDVNTDWYSYYDNIVGDIKKIITCDVVNPAKGFIMETGDIVTMSDMGVDPGGHTWTQSGSQYYMITDLNRSVGKVSITLREVG